MYIYMCCSELWWLVGVILFWGVEGCAGTKRSFLATEGSGFNLLQWLVFKNVNKGTRWCWKLGAAIWKGLTDLLVVPWDGIGFLQNGFG